MFCKAKYRLKLGLISGAVVLLKHLFWLPPLNKPLSKVLLNPINLWKLLLLGNPKITMNNNGDLGIGTTTPTKAKVEINGSINYYVSNARYFTNSTSNYSGVTSQNRPLSLYTSNMIAKTK